MHPLLENHALAAIVLCIGALLPAHTQAAASDGPAANASASQDQETPKMSVTAIYKVIAASINKRYELLSVEELEKKRAAGTPMTLVDCRMPGTYAKSHIEGAINVPLTVFETDHGAIPRDKPVVLICYLGMFSRVGAQLLVEEGYPTVYSVSGGMKEWDKAHAPRTGN